MHKLMENENNEKVVIKYYFLGIHNTIKYMHIFFKE